MRNWTGYDVTDHTIPMELHWAIAASLCMQEEAWALSTEALVFITPFAHRGSWRKRRTTDSAE